MKMLERMLVDEMSNKALNARFERKLDKRRPELWRMNKLNEDKMRFGLNLRKVMNFKNVSKQR